MIDTAVGRTALTFRTLELWSGRKARVSSNDFAQAQGRFYLRTEVEDHPGALAQITHILGENKISIASILQHEPPDQYSPGDLPRTVPLVIMTHLTSEGATKTACERIDKLDCTCGPAVRMWVRD